MINLDKSEYRKLAGLIKAFHENGHTWTDAQSMALAHMKRYYGWSPS